MPYSINMDYPGYNTEQAITNVCDLINRYGFKDVLEFGPFGGRLTHAMCANFPDSQFTAVERMGYPDINAGISVSEAVSTARVPYKAPTFGPQYADLIINEAWFRSEHTFQNLTLVNDDYFTYMPEHTRLFPEPGHDLVIVNMGPEPFYNFELVYDRALWLSCGMVIGFVNNHYTSIPTEATVREPAIKSDVDLYDCELLTNNIIRINTKI